VSETKQKVLAQLKEMKAAGINNILALRGDPPEGEARPESDFKYARELVAFIRDQGLDFCVGVAGYPEGHRESGSIQKDTEYLKQKVAAGADYVISQLFFDNKFFKDLLARCQNAGIKVPIIPGIMPITSLKQIKKMTEICGATIPDGLMKRLEELDDDKEAIKKLGIEQAVGQCRELIAAKVPGMHFFVLNQSGPISEILKRLKFSRQL
jgi:methylenetetrahydrofolate reductase (NADPH)